MRRIGGVERSQPHAEKTAELVTDMNPEYFAALTTSMIAGTPLDRVKIVAAINAALAGQIPLRHDWVRGL